MPKVQFDSDSKGRPERVPVPPGEYRVFISDIREDTRPGDGVLYWNTTLEVSEGPHAGAWIYDRLTFEPHVAWKSRAMYEACFGPADDGEYDLRSDDFIGMELVVKTKLHEYNGKTTARVAYWIPFEESAPAPATEPAPAPAKGKGKRKADQEDYPF